MAGTAPNPPRVAGSAPAGRRAHARWRDSRPQPLLWRASAVASAVASADAVDVALRALRAHPGAEDEEADEHQERDEDGLDRGLERRALRRRGHAEGSLRSGDGVDR